MEANAEPQAISPPETVWTAALRNIWQWSRDAVKVRKPRRLRVCETLSLGERRFLAVIEFDRQEFLVGGTGSSLEVLARLDDGRVVAEPPVQGRPRSI
jgi:flagellar biogenesis protein FliO